MTFILNESEIETAQIKAADDIHRPNVQAAVLTLARLMEWTNWNSDGWAYWKKPAAAATKLQVLVRDYSHYDFEKGDIPARDLKAAYTPIKAFLTRNSVHHSIVFPNE